MYIFPFEYDYRHFVQNSNQIYSVSDYKNKNEWKVNNLTMYTKIVGHLYSGIFSTLMIHISLYSEMCINEYTLSIKISLLKWDNCILLWKNISKNTVL